MAISLWLTYPAELGKRWTKGLQARALFLAIAIYERLAHFI